MKSVLIATGAIALMFTAGTGVAAQVGIKVPAPSLRDSAQTLPLFSQGANSAASQHDWTLPLPAARIAAAPVRGQPREVHCSMPVFVPDSRKQDRMPISHFDPTLVERMPVAMNSCTNPLWHAK